MADARKLRGRIYEADLVSERGFRVQQMQDYRKRMLEVDQMYRGEWAVVFQDESLTKERPHVMNLVQTALDDFAKLVTEATPSTKCFPTKDTEKAQGEANVRSAIADTYDTMNNIDLLEPRLAMDIAGAGAAYLLVYNDEKADYPCVMRLDPRYCYPDLVNGRLQSLLVVEDMNYRIAARQFPKLGLDKDPTLQNKKIEVLHYYDDYECLQAVSWGSGPENMEVTRRWDPKGRMPIAFVQLDSFDGALRGMFDQVAGSMRTKNKILRQLLDYTDDLVYSDPEMKGVLNMDKTVGDGRPWELDPTVPDARVQRVAPAGTPPQVLQILDYLDREQRGGSGYPAARQGEVSQSIASASFVASTQGQLTSTVRNLQRLLGSLLAQTHELCFMYDEKYKDMQKPLIRPIGTKKNYTPSRDINGEYKNIVSYGASAGLDRAAADTRLIQLLGAGIISKEDARDQVDFISDPASVKARVQMEASEDILLQKTLSGADPMLLMTIITAMTQGATFEEAVAAATQAAQAAAQAQATPGAPAGPEGATAPGQPGMAPPAGPPGAAAPPVTFAPPPQTDISVSTPMPARPAQGLRGGPGE